MQIEGIDTNGAEMAIAMAMETEYDVCLEWGSGDQGRRDWGGDTVQETVDASRCMSAAVCRAMLWNADRVIDSNEMGARSMCVWSVWHRVMILLCAWIYRLRTSYGLNPVDQDRDLKFTTKPKHFGGFPKRVSEASCWSILWSRGVLCVDGGYTEYPWLGRGRGMAVCGRTWSRADRQSSSCDVSFLRRTNRTGAPP